MARAFHILWAGRHRRSAWETLCEDYRRRLKRVATVRDQAIRARTSGADRSRRRDEGRALLAARPEPCYTVVLDLGGRRLSSPQLAAELKRLHESWPHPIAFLIGSDLGLDPEVVAAADLRLSLGVMTFGHELARLVLYEQLYRASAIERGIKYHRPPL